jgi:tRNA-Thr(GGU) m(6)t(6)A37 methyltransferase TsaA
MADEIVFQPIGTIHSLFKDIQGMPIQGALFPDYQGTVEIDPEYAEGLKDIEGFSHLILLYHFHRAKGYDLVARPFLDNQMHGLFTIRGPRRPNPIGMTVVRLLKRVENILYIGGVDMMDGTPVLDIKPYFPDVDSHPDAKVGWMGDKLKQKGRYTISDDRFSNS